MTPIDKISLRLLAQDAEDLKILSAAMQDAIGKVGDISFEPKSRRLTLAFNRYRWEAKSGARVRSALQFGGVLGVQTRKIRRDARDAVLEFLALSFEPGEAPGGVISICCAGGGDIRISVECVEAVLADLSSSWPTPRTPAHDS